MVMSASSKALLSMVWSNQVLVDPQFGMVKGTSNVCSSGLVHAFQLAPHQL